MIVFSADPGTKNFACAITEHRYENGRMVSKILATGMIKDCIRTLNEDVYEELARFERELVRIRDYYKPDIAVFERFQSRGLKGTTIECINMMLAILIRVFRKCKPRLFLASTWKNRINKRADLKATYKEFKLTSKKSPKTIHEFDATLIGFYAATRHYGMVDFQCFTPTNWNPFVEWFLTRPGLAKL
jgi:hypothetical protein